MKLEITVREVGEDSAVITLSGEMDIHSSPRLLEEISTLVGGGRHFIVLDLSALIYLDSTGLGTLSAGLKRAGEAGGFIRLVSPRPAVTKVLKLSELDLAIQAFENIEEALAVRT